MYQAHRLPPPRAQRRLADSPSTNLGLGSEHPSSSHPPGHTASYTEASNYDDATGTTLIGNTQGPSDDPNPTGVGDMTLARAEQNHSMLLAEEELARVKTQGKEADMQDNQQIAISRTDSRSCASGCAAKKSWMAHFVRGYAQMAKAYPPASLKVLALWPHVYESICYRQRKPETR